MGFPQGPPANVPPPPPHWGGFTPADPGHIPLRPLTVGEILGTAFGVVKRHFGLLGGLGVVLGALPVAARWVWLVASGQATFFASGAWVGDALSAGRVTLPSDIVAAISVSFALLVIVVLVLAGVTTSCAAADAVSRSATRSVISQRLAGRWPTMVIAAVLVGITAALGLAVLVVPGVLVFAFWALTAPVAVMEGDSVAGSLHRAVALSRGNRGRILGASLLVVVIAVAIDTGTSLLIQVLAGTGRSGMQLLLLGDSASIAVSSMTLPWVAAVLAVLYIDIRVRKEDLGPALRRYAAGPQ